MVTLKKTQKIKSEESVRRRQSGVDGASPSSSSAQPGLTADPIFEPARPGPLKTSYWRVSEALAFPELLRTFGTDWANIADSLQTKTAIMVKNYYVQNIKEGNKSEWEQIAMEADARVLILDS